MWQLRTECHKNNITQLINTPACAPSNSQRNIRRICCRCDASAVGANLHILNQTCVCCRCCSVLVVISGIKYRILKHAGNTRSPVCIVIMISVIKPYMAHNNQSKQKCYIYLSWKINFSQQQRTTQHSMQGLTFSPTK